MSDSTPQNGDVKGKHKTTDRQYLYWKWSFTGLEVTKSANNDFEEIRIPVPWGHIAGKMYLKFLNKLDLQKA